MNILVAKNGAQLGPFSENDVRARLASGEFAPSDYGWHEGLPAWTPLTQLLGTATPPPSYAPQPYSAPAGQNAPGGYAPQPHNSPYPQVYQPGAPTSFGASAANYGGFWQRFLAYVIDAVIVFVPLAAMLVVFGIVVGMTASDHPGPHEDNPVLDLLVVLIAVAFLLIVWFYFAGMESSARQATLGKRALGLRVTDLNGNRISFWRATGRFFGKALSGQFFGVGYLLAAFTARKQALHDLMASTLVVQG